jgi:hypothetical protein
LRKNCDHASSGVEGRASRCSLLVQRPHPKLQQQVHGEMVHRANCFPWLKVRDATSKFP